MELICKNCKHFQAGWCIRKSGGPQQTLFTIGHKTHETNWCELFEKKDIVDETDNQTMRSAILRNS